MEKPYFSTKWEKYLISGLIDTMNQQTDRQLPLAWDDPKNGILLPKLFWPSVKKNYSSDWEKLLKIEAEGREFAKNLRSLEQFVQTVKVPNFW